MIRFLPPYSPDFNPIELAFAKLKAFLRAARPRTFDQVTALTAAALALFTPAECRNYVRHCGYRLAKTTCKWPADIGKCRVETAALDLGCDVCRLRSADRVFVGSTQPIRRL